MKGIVSRHYVRGAQSRRVGVVCRLCGTPRPTRLRTRLRGRCRACATFGD